MNSYLVPGFTKQVLWMPSSQIWWTETGATDRQNRIDRRQRELEAEIRSLRKQLAEKNEVIDVLKKSVGIFSKL